MKAPRHRSLARLWERVKEASRTRACLCVCPDALNDEDGNERGRLPANASLACSSQQLGPERGGGGALQRQSIHCEKVSREEGMMTCKMINGCNVLTSLSISPWSE